MAVELRIRKRRHVEVFWEKSQDREIQRLFPSGISSLAEALSLYQQSLQEDATSYGKVIYHEGRYIGDIWCYDIQNGHAMISIVIFAKDCWGKGLGVEATKLFLAEVFAKYDLVSMGAFTYAVNSRAISLLEKVGFVQSPCLVRAETESKYFAIKRPAQHPEKWRKTINPFTLRFKRFRLQEILGYPHAGNDVFHVRGQFHGQSVRAYLKVERQKTADLEREISVLSRLSFPFAPTLLEYSLGKPRFILTKEAPGRRLSEILGDNENMQSLAYLEAYGGLLAQIHSAPISCPPVKSRDFTLPHEFYVQQGLEPVERFLRGLKPIDSKCFIHGDCHYANILWQDGQVSCLLDYELSGHGSREFDLAWALLLRPGQKFLKTEGERQALLSAYAKYHDYSRQALEYYLVLFAMKFLSIATGEQEAGYREFLNKMVKNIV